MGNISSNTDPSSEEDFHMLSRQIKKLCAKIGICSALMVVLAFTVLLIGYGFGATTMESVQFPDHVYYMDYNVYNLSSSEKNEKIKLGFEIFRNTSSHLGPKQKDSSKIMAGNNLSCASCHLNGGTKPYAAPLIGVVKRFPQYRGREDKMGTIEERINGCMERSMNGRTMPDKSAEMSALVAYMDWLGRAAPSDGKIEGQGFLSINIPNRAVDLTQGKKVFELRCVECHGMDGQGQLQQGTNTYLYPPLWGNDSYNNGAGMTRVITAAQFIKGNMPFGTTYDRPILTDAEAYDVAGYINQQLRPAKPNREADFPDLVKKPVSTPYGPYVDPFSTEQHQLGPFQPIMEYYQKEHQVRKTK